MLTLALVALVTVTEFTVMPRRGAVVVPLTKT